MRRTPTCLCARLGSDTSLQYNIVFSEGVVGQGALSAPTTALLAPGVLPRVQRFAPGVLSPKKLHPGFCLHPGFYPAVRFAPGVGWTQKFCTLLRPGFDCPHGLVYGHEKMRESTQKVDFYINKLVARHGKTLVYLFFFACGALSSSMLLSNIMEESFNSLLKQGTPAQLL